MDRTWVKKSASEVLLIVIAVLIALGIDSYAESRRETRLAERYVASLEGDLQGDTTVVRRGFLLLDMKDQGILSLERALRGEGISAGRLSLSLGFATDPNVTTFNDGTYSDLVSSGNLHLLDFETRRLLADLYRTFGDYRTYQENTAHPLRGLRSYMASDVRDGVVRCWVSSDCIEGRGHSEATFSEMESLAAEILRRPGASDTTMLGGWTSDPDLALQLQGELAESRTWRRRLELLNSSILETLAHLEALK